MTERAEFRPTREQWNSLGILAGIAGGGVGAWVDGPIGSLVGIATGPALTAVAAITTEKFRQARRKSLNKYPSQ